MAYGTSSLECDRRLLEVAIMWRVDDPYAVLGLTPAASDEEVADAYRDLAKQLHPDVAQGPAAHAQMAQLNAAYDEIRFGDRNGDGEDGGAPGASGGPPPRRGSWLSERMRAALGPELLGALEPFEDVRLITPASTWQSPTAVLVVTDRRLLWLADDAVMGRVHQLRHDDVGEVDHTVRRPLRRRAVLRVRTATGRRLSFGDLRPDVAALAAKNVADAMAPSSP